MKFCAAVFFDVKQTAKPTAQQRRNSGAVEVGAADGRRRVNVAPPCADLL
jgi:hypothetical protein